MKAHNSDSYGHTSSFINEQWAHIYGFESYAHQQAFEAQPVLASLLSPDVSDLPMHNPDIINYVRAASGPDAIIPVFVEGAFADFATSKLRALQAGDELAALVRSISQGQRPELEAFVVLHETDWAVLGINAARSILFANRLRHDQDHYPELSVATIDAFDAFLDSASGSGLRHGDD